MLKFIKKIFNDSEKNESENQFIKRVKLFEGLKGKEFRHIAPLLIPKKFKKDEVIFRENYPHVVLYIVKTGQISIYLENNGVPTGLVILKEYEHFGEIGLFGKDVKRAASAKALVDTELYAIKKTDFKEFVKKYPATGVKILYNIGKSISDDLIRSNNEITKNEYR